MKYQFLLKSYLKKKISSLNKGKPENSFNIAKNQEFELITFCHFENLSKTHMKQSMKSNFLKKFKVIASTALRPYFRFFFLKKDFSENSVNLDMGI